MAPIPRLTYRQRICVPSQFTSAAAGRWMPPSFDWISMQCLPSRRKMVRVPSACSPVGGAP
jgi:hypothetical protein